MITLADLISRLCAAGGPDRELDLAISVAINFRDQFNPDREWRWGAGADEIEGHALDGRARFFLDPAQFVPRWTRHIDTAVLLVPDSYFIGLQRFSDGWYASVRLKSTGLPFTGDQKPAAIALCIAALKARAGAEHINQIAANSDESHAARPSEEGGAGR